MSSRAERGISSVGLGTSFGPEILRLHLRMTHRRGRPHTHKGHRRAVPTASPSFPRRGGNLSPVLDTLAESCPAGPERAAEKSLPLDKGRYRAQRGGGIEQRETPTPHRFAAPLQRSRVNACSPASRYTRTYMPPFRSRRVHQSQDNQKRRPGLCPRRRLKSI